MLTFHQNCFWRCSQLLIWLFCVNYWATQQSAVTNDNVSCWKRLHNCCMYKPQGIPVISCEENKASIWCLKWWVADIVICLERGADLHTAQLMPLPLTVSCSSKILIGFTFLVPTHPGSPGKRAVKRVCVCRRFLMIVLMLTMRLNNSATDVTDARGEGQ